MSKIKVNNIEAASGSTITIPSTQTLKIEGNLEGGGLTAAVASAIAGYNDGSGASDANTYYSFNFVNSPIIDYKYGATLNSVGRVTITDGGAGYAIGDQVAFLGGGGSGAAGQLVLTQATAGINTISSITITNAGTGYTSDPTVTVTSTAGSGFTASVERTSPIVGFQMGQIQSLLARTKFVSGVLTDVVAGCGEFFQFANSTSTTSPGGFSSPWFNIGNCPTGTTFAISSAVASGRGDPTATIDNSFPFGWFWADISRTGWASTARGLSRWIYDYGTRQWLYVTGGQGDAPNSLNVGGGFWCWSDTLGWHWSRCDLFPYFYISSPYNWTSLAPGSGNDVGWSWFKPSTDFTERTSALYLYGSSKWVNCTGTGANHPLANTNMGVTDSGQPNSTPVVNAPPTPTVIVETQ